LLAEAGSGTVRNQAIPPEDTISRTRQIPQSDGIEIACDNLNPNGRMLLFERLVQVFLGHAGSGS
jgi:hypothetical protein